MAPGEAKREAILQAAQGLMLKHGLRGTSMEAIAREAGVAKPTLYAYFADKPAVFAALVERLIAEWRDNFIAGLRGEGDIVQRVGAALTAKHKGAMRLLAGSPHAAELYGEHERTTAPQFRVFDAEVAAALEAELTAAGVARPAWIAWPGGRSRSCCWPSRRCWPSPCCAATEPPGRRPARSSPAGG